jgi:ketosteroid isomerase-like protein
LPGLASGKAGVRQLFEMFHLAFDQARVEVDDMIAEGDKVFVLARMTGT